MPVLTRTSGGSAVLQRIADLPRSSRRRAVEAVLLLALVALPLLSNDAFLVGRFGRYLVWAVFALSLDLVWGFGGMLTFGHAAFFGGAGYVVALLTTKELGPLPLTVWPAIALATLAAGALALVVSLVAFRGRAPLRGVEFALVTLAVAFLMELTRAGVTAPIRGARASSRVKASGRRIPFFEVVPARLTVSCR